MAWRAAVISVLALVCLSGHHFVVGQAQHVEEMGVTTLPSTESVETGLPECTCIHVHMAGLIKAEKLSDGLYQLLKFSLEQQAMDLHKIDRPSLLSQTSWSKSWQLLSRIPEKPYLEFETTRMSRNYWARTRSTNRSLTFSTRRQTHLAKWFNRRQVQGVASYIRSSSKSPTRLLQCCQSEASAVTHLSCFQTVPCDADENAGFGEPTTWILKYYRL